MIKCHYQECRFTKAEVQKREFLQGCTLFCSGKAFPWGDAQADVIKFIEHLPCVVKAILYISLLYPLLATTHQTWKLLKTSTKVLSSVVTAMAGQWNGAP